MAANDSLSDELQCPVCLLVPRDVPIPACPVGHLVCQSCRVNINTCPTCRRPMLQDGTNTLANKLVERVSHPCKYSQCQVKNYLKEIVQHEARCPERTIKCPYLECDEEVKIAEYYAHAMASTDCNYQSFTLSNTLTSCLVIQDGETIQNYLSTTNLNWAMREFQYHGKTFYFHQHYFSAEKTFAFYVTAAEHLSEAKKYLAKMTLKNQNDEKKTVTMIQDVISMDSAPSNMDSVLASESVMFIHYKTMSGFMKLSKETKEGKDISRSIIQATVDIILK